LILRTLLKAQKADDKFVHAFELIKNNKIAEANASLEKLYLNGKQSYTLSVEQGLLVRILANHIQILVPLKANEAQQMLLRAHHDAPMAGHLSKTRTRARLLERYFWPKVYKDTLAFCKTCPTCQLHKDRRQRFLIDL
jgi:hypothetical protein